MQKLSNTIKTATGAVSIGESARPVTNIIAQRIAEVYTKNAEITPGKDPAKSARERASILPGENPATSAPFTSDKIAYSLGDVKATEPKFSGNTVQR